MADLEHHVAATPSTNYRLASVTKQFTAASILLFQAATAFAVRGGAPRERSWKRTDQSLTSAVLGDGGICSSVDDLAKWDKALYGSGPFRNVIVRFPKRRFTVVILTNRNDPEPYTTALAVAKLFIPQADAKRASQVVVGPDSAARPMPQTH